MLLPLVVLSNCVILIHWSFSMLWAVPRAVFGPLKDTRAYRQLKRIMEYNLTEPRPVEKSRTTGFAGRFPVLRWLLIMVIVLNWVCLITAGIVGGMMLCGTDSSYAKAIILLCVCWIGLLGGGLAMIGQLRFERLREACRTRRRAQRDPDRGTIASPTQVHCELWPACWKWSPILNEPAAMLPTPWMVIISFLVMGLRGRLPDGFLGSALIDLSLATAVVAACCFVRAFVRNQSPCQNNE